MRAAPPSRRMSATSRWREGDCDDPVTRYRTRPGPLV
jgi:hypothetical protein